jgi:hypothetical protein
MVRREHGRKWLRRFFKSQFFRSKTKIPIALTVAPAQLAREDPKELSTAPAAFKDAGEIGAATILASHFDPASKAANYFLPFVPINISPNGSHTRGPALQVLLPKSTHSFARRAQCRWRSILTTSFSRRHGGRRRWLSPPLLLQTFGTIATRLTRASSMRFTASPEP